MSYPSRIVPTLQALCAQLEDAGIRASVDRSKVNAPGAWVSPQLTTTHTLDASGRMRVHVYLIGPTGADDLTVLKTLAGLLDLALTVLTPDEDVDTSYSVALPHTPTATFPAFRLVVDVDL